VPDTAGVPLYGVRSPDLLDANESTSQPSDYRALVLDSGVRSTVRPVMTLAVIAANRAMP
jgi:hypothetical protein